ncbi:MAG: rRNA pseudouridine synthase [Bacteroidia bacterium]|nr:rRNA pseudouridine synthase [Bacteroidia bacterium]
MKKRPHKISNKQSADLKEKKEKIREIKARVAASRVQPPLRLNQYIAKAGVCSRREADALIQRGDIKVNGKVVKEMGMQVTPGKDEVEYKGNILNPQKNVYILLNKPKNMIAATSDERGRKIVMDVIERVTKERVYPVGSLDRNTTGLLLLTNDGKLAERITKAPEGMRQVFKATLDKPITPEHLEKLAEGVVLEEGPAKVDSIGYANPTDLTVVGLEIQQGRTHMIRGMFSALGYEVTGLDRTMLGTLTKKNLPRGKWRELTFQEVSWLKMLQPPADALVPKKKK